MPVTAARAGSAWSPLTPSIKELAPDCQWGSRPLDPRPPPQVAGIQNKLKKKSFPPDWPLYWLLSSEWPDPTFAYKLAVRLSCPSGFIALD